jgi:hypothetical protein
MKGGDDKDGVKIRGKTRRRAKIEAKTEAEMMVKPEPMDEMLPAAPRRRKVRTDDTMLSSDEDVDVNMAGERVSTGTGTTTPEADVARTQAVDLSDSEPEDDDEDMTGDFVKEDGMVSLARGVHVVGLGLSLGCCVMARGLRAVASSSLVFDREARRCGGVTAVLSAGEKGVMKC